MLKPGSYLVAVSGGSDSMALLDMMRQEASELIVAHVNYKKRSSADRDEQIVQAYCQQYKLPFKVLYPIYQHGNFQAWAREVRYDFFRQLIKEYQLQGVVVAHHQDDVLETYLMQKQAQRIPLYWGIKAETVIDGLTIYRPLLEWTKKQLLNYCRQHNLNYGYDETNDSNQYQRNRIRHQQINKLTDTEKAQLLQEIKQANDELEKQQCKIKRVLQTLGNHIDINDYQKIEKAIRKEVLRQWLMRQKVNSQGFTSAHLDNIDAFLLSNQARSYKIGDTLWLYREYGNAWIETQQQSESYHYVVEKGQILTTPYFQMATDGPKICGVYVTDDDYPLVIRSPKPQDAIALRFGRKKLNRWFIDRKIPHKLRETWPIVVNRKAEVILVPGIGCNISHFANNLNLFVVK